MLATKASSIAWQYKYPPNTNKSFTLVSVYGIDQYTTYSHPIGRFINELFNGCYLILQISGCPRLVTYVTVLIHILSRWDLNLGPLDPKANVLPSTCNSQLYSKAVLCVPLYKHKLYIYIYIQDRPLYYTALVAKVPFLLFTKQSRFLTTLNRNLLKTLWEKEKMLVNNIFSFSHNVFYLSQTFQPNSIVVCKLYNTFNLDQSKNLLFEKE